MLRQDPMPTLAPAHPGHLCNQSCLPVVHMQLSTAQGSTAQHSTIELQVAVSVEAAAMFKLCLAVRTAC